MVNPIILSSLSGGTDAKDIPVVGVLKGACGVVGRLVV
jgi:hypothetical protein